MKRTLLLPIVAGVALGTGVYAHQKNEAPKDSFSDDFYRAISRDILVDQVYKGCDISRMELRIEKRSNYVFVTSDFPDDPLLHNYTVVWLKAPLMHYGIYKEGIIKPDNFKEMEASDSKFSSAVEAFGREFDKRIRRKPKS